MKPKNQAEYMMEDKQEIMDRLQKENPHSIPTFKAMDTYWNIAIDRCIVVLESFSEGQSMPNKMRLVELKHRFLALKK